MPLLSRLSTLACAAALAASLPPAFAQAAGSGKALPDEYVRNVADCTTEVSADDYADQALLYRSDTEVQQALRQAMANYQAERARCLRSAAAPHQANRAVAADLTARLARNDKDTEQLFLRAREVVEADPARFFKPMLESSELASVRALVAQARDYKPVAQLCPPLAAVVPQSPAETQAANQALTAHRQCLAQVATAARTAVDFRAADFADASLRIANLERYTCARKPGPRCVPDASWRPAAETFSPANAALVERAAQTQERRMPELQEAKSKMDSWREQVNAHVQQRNAEIAARNRQRAEQAPRQPERSTGTYYGGGDLQPPSVPIRRDSSVSAPGMR